MLTRKGENLVTTQPLDRELQGSNVCWEGELALPGLSPWLVIQYKWSALTIYIGWIKTDPAGSMYLSICCNNNKQKEAIKLGLGRILEGMKGGNDVIIF